MGHDPLAESLGFSYGGVVRSEAVRNFSPPVPTRGGGLGAMRFIAAILVILALGIVVADLASAEVTVNLQVAADGLTAPLNLVSPPDGTKRRFIVEQIGVIKILMPDGKILDEPFLNIRHRIPKLHAGLRRARPPQPRVPSRTSRTTAGSSSPTAATCPATPRSTRSSGTTTRTTSPSTGSPSPNPNKADPLERTDPEPGSTGRSSTTTATGSASGPTGSSTSRRATAATRTTGGSATTSRRGTART